VVVYIALDRGVKAAELVAENDVGLHQGECGRADAK